MVGKSMARSTRSGTLVGPGICRKWRPARRVIGFPFLHFECKNPADARSFADARTREERVSLAVRLAREVDGEVLFDAASRSRYSTDASIYQVEPIGIVVPRTEEAARAAIAIAVDEGVPILPRGAGSSQCGQAVGAALIIDHSKFLNRIVELDLERARAIVQPGVVLDALNAELRRQGFWFPVDVSTSAQATLGGM